MGEHNGSDAIDQPDTGGGGIMAPRQHLYSEAIYRLNSELQDIREASGSFSNINLVPAAFDRRRRGFRWLTVDNNNWKWSQKLLDAAKNALVDLIDDWDQQSEGLGDRWYERLPRPDNKWDFGDLYHCWKKIRQADVGVDADGNWPLDTDLKCHRALLELVAGRVSSGELYIDGLVLKMIRNGSKSGKRLKWVVNRLLADEYTDEKIIVKPTAFVCHYASTSTSIYTSQERYYSQTDGRDFASGDELANHMEGLPPKQRDWELALQDAILPFEKQLRRVVSVPIYDGGTPRDPWGRLVGIVHLTIYDNKDDESCNALAQTVIKRADRLPMAFRTIARAQVAGAPIDEARSETGMTAQHFLRLLAAFHDWEHVKVCRLGEPDAERRIECWGHGSAGREWHKSLDGCATCEAGSPPNVRLDGLDQLIRMRWASTRDLDDIAKLRFDLTLPDYTLVPSGSKERESLYRQYKHELIDIFRLVLPKVQRHRYAIRTAATAIMGRNMSHNIGSHVLSSVAAEPYSARAKDAQINARRDLFRYLQERMDFLAEVATTQHYMSLPSQLSAIMPEFKHQALLREHITAANNTKNFPAALEVNEEPPTPLSMALPGGRHGSHAFYVLIENIARNSAKHRPNQIDDKVNLKIRIDELNPKGVNCGTDSLPCSLINDALLQIRIWDDAGNGGAAEDGKKPLFEYLNDIIQNQSIIDDFGMLRDGNWGIREMVVAAAYLRRVDIEDIESFFEQPDILRALVVNSDGASSTDSTHLCYEFFVHRAETVFAPGLTDAGEAKQLLTAGIRVGTTGDKHGKAFDQKYLLIQNDEPQTPRLPVRRLKLITGKSGENGCVEKDTLCEAVISESPAADTWVLVAEAWLEHIRSVHELEDAQLYYSIEQEKNGRKDEGRCGKSVTILKDDDLRNAVIYDHHCLLKDHDADYVKRALFWEFYDGNSDQEQLFEHPPKDERRALEAEFLTAALARIIVLDERVQDDIEKHPPITEGHTTVAMIDAVKCRRIYVPPRSLVNLRGSTTRTELCKYLVTHKCLNKQRQECHLDFVVVHLGILERLPSPGPNEMGVIDWIRAVVEDLGAELVICSGRGMPPSVKQAHVRFVPLSSVLRWVIHRPSKFHLYDLLCASRSPRDA